MAKISYLNIYVLKSLEIKKKQILTYLIQINH